MKLDELRVRHRRSRPQGHRHTVSGRLHRVGRHGEQLPRPPGGQDHVPSLHGHDLSVWPASHDAPASAAGDHEVEREPALEDRGGGPPGRLDQRPLDLGPGGRPTRVHHPRLRVAPLPGQRQTPRGFPIEFDSEGHQLLDPRRPLVHQHPDRVDVTETGACGQGVCQVQVGRVLVASEHRRHAPLGPACGGLPELALGQDADLAGGRATGHATAEPDGDGEAGHPASDHQHIEARDIEVRDTTISDGLVPEPGVGAHDLEVTAPPSRSRSSRPRARQRSRRSAGWRRPRARRRGRSPRARRSSTRRRSTR